MMNLKPIKGRWKQLKGNVKHLWEEFNDDLSDLNNAQFSVYANRNVTLAKKMQGAYIISEEESNKLIAAYQRRQ
jgi:hypothetical protein